MKNYDKHNCQNMVRDVHYYCGMSFLLIGRFAHEWSIIETINDKPIRETVFPNRISARRQFKIYQQLKEE